MHRVYSRLASALAVLLISTTAATIVGAQTTYIDEDWQNVTNPGAATTPVTATGLQTPASGWTLNQQFTPARAGAAASTKVWSVTNVIGSSFPDPAPAAAGTIWCQFLWTLSATNYSVALVSPQFNASTHSAVTLDFLAQIDGFSVTANAETFEIWYIDNAAAVPTWTQLQQYSFPAGDNSTVITPSLNLNVVAGSSNFQVAFVAQGANSGNMDNIIIDNLSLVGSGTFTTPDIEVYEGVGTAGTQFPNPGTVTGLSVGPVATGYDYTIENDASATGNLTMPATPVSFSITAGATAVNVSITQPGSLNLAAGATTGFVVNLNAIGTGGAFTVQVSIASNDPTDNPFVINISGTATVNNPARANPETVTSSPVFTGSADAGPFGFAADPGTSVASSLTIDDADADDVLITNITPAGAQAGITAAASAAGPAASLSVNFTGTLDANAAPGVYTWTIDIEDDQVPAGTRTVTVNITLNNVAPVGTNTAIAPTTGTGVDLPNAYTRTFFETTTVATTNLFDVTDVNLGQTLAILSQTRTGGTGTTFPFNGQFAITGSAGSFTVSVSTAGALVSTDVGTHEYQLVIEDVTGGNQITVFVTLTVSAQTAPTFTGGTAVSIAQGASSTGVVVGDAADAQDPFTALGVAATTVPTGITVSAIAVNGTTGEVTATISVGAAATVGTNTITFTVTDSLSATGTGNFDVNVTANTIPSITAGSAVSMGTSASVTNRTIATVSDAEDAAGTLTVTVVTAPAGVAVTAITNTTGTVTATITTTAATAGANIVVLQVMDSDGATATANLTVNVSTGGGGGGGGGGDDDGGGCAASGSSSSLWLALFGLMAVAAMALRVRRSRA